MGHWTLFIQGHGPNGNKAEGDSDYELARLVEKLKASGHTITLAEFIYGQPALIAGNIQPE